MEYLIKIRDAKGEKTVRAEPGVNLLKILYAEGCNLSSPCGGEGVCGKCKIRILSGGPGLTGNEEKLLSRKEIAAGYRLACQIRVESDLDIELENEEEIEVLTGGLDGEYSLDPSLRKVLLTPPQATLADQQDYLQRLLKESAAADSSQISLKALQGLASMIRPEEREPLPRKVTVSLRDGRLVAMEAGDRSRRNYGIAVDIGTTTVALYLLDLTNGNQLDVYSLHNPQKKFGADVISRVNYTLKEKEGTAGLQSVLVEGLNRAASELCRRNGLETGEVMQMTVVGNTIMLHSLLGISAASIARSPYVPIFTSGLELRPEELGLELHADGAVVLLPSVSGYIGADIIADLLAADFSSGWNLLIDIGTNGEIVLGRDDKLYACSAAAGPAFEGAGITFGMAGVPGAVSSYRLDGKGRVDYETIGRQKARGICGSGLVDIIAALLRWGFLSSSGALAEADKLPPNFRELLTEYEGVRAFRVIPGGEKDGAAGDILLTQKDIREFQLARGAISAGINILLQEAGVDYQAVENVYLAGGFGNFIDPESACMIGLIPGELREKIVRIGNGAGTGARMYLLDRKLRGFAEELKRRVEYIELSSRPDFQNQFMDSMFFPRADGTE